MKYSTKRKFMVVVVIGDAEGKLADLRLSAKQLFKDNGLTVPQGFEFDFTGTERKDLTFDIYTIHLRWEIDGVATVLYGFSNDQVDTSKLTESIPHSIAICRPATEEGEINVR